MHVLGRKITLSCHFDQLRKIFFSLYAMSTHDVCVCMDLLDLHVGPPKVKQQHYRSSYV